MCVFLPRVHFYILCFPTKIISRLLIDAFVHLTHIFWIFAPGRALGTPDELALLGRHPCVASRVVRSRLLFLLPAQAAGPPSPTVALHPPANQSVSACPDLCPRCLSLLRVHMLLSDICGGLPDRSLSCWPPPGAPDSSVWRLCHRPSEGPNSTRPETNPGLLLPNTAPSCLPQISDRVESPAQDRAVSSHVFKLFVVF